jgi:putative transposase
MRRSQTASFVTELPLVVDSKIEKKLLAKFQAGRQLYNACLHEAMARMNLVKNSDAYTLAKKLFKGKARSVALRVNNPNNYYLDFKAKKGRKTVIKKGKSIKGKRQYEKSKTYLKTTIKKRELERRKTAYAKSQNRQIINDILRHGSHIKTEDVSVKGWQKRYGKAIGAKSPGFVQSELKRKAESANGSFQKFSTRKTALSQTHLNGKRIKKSLSQRVHYDLTGVIMHRDLFSAFLARYVNDEDNLLLQSAQQEWIRLESVLKSAWQEFQINCKQVSASESRLCHSPSEQFDLKLGNISQISYVELKANTNS